MIHFAIFDKNYKTIIMKKIFIATLSFVFLNSCSESEKEIKLELSSSLENHLITKASKQNILTKKNELKTLSYEELTNGYKAMFFVDVEVTKGEETKHIVDTFFCNFDKGINVLGDTYPTDYGKKKDEITKALIKEFKKSLPEGMSIEKFEVKKVMDIEGGYEAESDIKVIVNNKVVEKKSVYSYLDLQMNVEDPMFNEKKRE